MGTQTLDVPVPNQVSPSALSDLNSAAALSERLRIGTLGWAGPWLVLIRRSVLIIAAQAITACVLGLQSHLWSWNAAAKRWTVYGTFVDTRRLAVMDPYTRQEGIRLGGPIRPL